MMSTDEKKKWRVCTRSDGNAGKSRLNAKKDVESDEKRGKGTTTRH
jgi:hypothetical protein